MINLQKLITEVQQGASAILARGTSAAAGSRASPEHGARVIASVSDRSGSTRGRKSHASVRLFSHICGRGNQKRCRWTCQMWRNGLLGDGGRPFHSFMMQ